MTRKPRYVIDTNVLVSAFLYPLSRPRQPWMRRLIPATCSCRRF